MIRHHSFDPDPFHEDLRWGGPTVDAAAQWHATIGALIITYTILGAPYEKHGIMGPETLV